LDVATIIERVAEQSLSGSVEGDSAGTAMILGFVQSTYDEVYGAIAAQYPTLLETTQNVTVTAGQGTLDPVPLKIVRVADTTNKRFLEVTTAEMVEDKDIDLDDVGQPDEFYITGGNKLNTYPKGSISARVRHIPFAATLVANGSESSIQFPAQFHDVLIWGALRHAAYDERDKGLGVELQATQIMFEKRLAALMDWLRVNQARPPVRTKAFL
jgi:hypothetical protein